MTDATSDRARNFRERLERWIGALSFEDKSVVLEWVEKALDGDPENEEDHAAQLVQLLMDGDAEVVGVKNGDVMFRLTAKGHEGARRLMLESAAARHLLKSLTGGAAVEGPDKPQ